MYVFVADACNENTKYKKDFQENDMNNKMDNNKSEEKMFLSE